MKKLIAQMIKDGIITNENKIKGFRKIINWKRNNLFPSWFDEYKSKKEE